MHENIELSAICIFHEFSMGCVHLTRLSHVSFNVDKCKVNSKVEREKIDWEGILFLGKCIGVGYVCK